jgi:hypothetical protein
MGEWLRGTEFELAPSFDNILRLLPFCDAVSNEFSGVRFNVVGNCQSAPVKFLRTSLELKLAISRVFLSAGRSCLF